MTVFQLLPVGDVGIMMKFSDSITDEASSIVHSADAAVHRARIPGVTETVPSYASLFVGFDPLVTDFENLSACLNALDIRISQDARQIASWDVPICYEEPHGPDLMTLSERLELDSEAIIDAHLSGDYRVSMYGFAPGYAYMRGVPEAIQIPRKDRPVNDVPAGSVIITGPQCLVTTLTMPTGWWVIGYSPFLFLRRSSENQFPIPVGSRIRFQRVSASELLALRSSSNK